MFRCSIAVVLALYLGEPLSVGLLPIGLRAEEPLEKPDSAAIRAAVVKAIPLLEKGARGSMEERSNCFTCHNQGFPIIALSTARAHGFQIDDELLQTQLKFIATFLEKNRTNFLEGKGTGGQVATAATALWTLEAGGWKADDNTAAVTEYLLKFEKSREHWIMTSNRPPTEHSHFTANYMAIRGLQYYGTDSQKERRDARFQFARQWLLNNSAKETEDRVFRLWGLKTVGAESQAVAAAQEELLKTQQSDGGWAQLDDKESDAYATGTALVALHSAGGLSTDSVTYRRGIAFLLKNQLDDGSWHVVSRSKPFQTYFESGFPHGTDQFISIAASSWAVAALAFACPEATTGG